MLLLYNNSISRDVRLELLAGLIDSDGNLKKTSKVATCFRISQIGEQLPRNIMYLAQSLGFRVNYAIEKYKKIMKVSKNDRIYRIDVSGDIQLIPTRIKRKQAVNNKRL